MIEQQKKFKLILKKENLKTKDSHIVEKISHIRYLPSSIRKKLYGVILQSENEKILFIGIFRPCIDRLRI